MKVRKSVLVPVHPADFVICVLALLTTCPACETADSDGAGTSGTSKAAGSGGSRVSGSAGKTAGRGGAGASGASGMNGGTGQDGGRSGGGAGSSSGTSADISCPAGVAASDYVVIRTKAQLEAFSDCREAGTVEIRGMVDYRIDADIVLPKLETAKVLIVTFTLTKTVRAPALVSAGVSISDNPRLEAIELPLLESGTTITIGECPSLKVLDLASLRTTGGFSLRKNPALEVLSLPSLETITDEGYADIQIGKVGVLDDRSELETATPLALARIELPSLKTVAGDISLGVVENLVEIEAPLLESMTQLISNNGVPPVVSFPALKTLGILNMWDDGDLISISMPVLQRINELQLRRNPKLASVEMPALETFGTGIFAVTHNPMLSTCALNSLAEQVAGMVSPYFDGNQDDCP